MNASELCTIARRFNSCKTSATLGTSKQEIIDFITRKIIKLAINGKFSYQTRLYFDSNEKYFFKDYFDNLGFNTRIITNDFYVDSPLEKQKYELIIDWYAD